MVAQDGPGLAEAVAKAGPALVESLDRLIDAQGGDVKPPWQFGEERRERRGQVHVGHDYAITATSTDEIAGR